MRYVSKCTFLLLVTLLLIPIQTPFLSKQPFTLSIEIAGTEITQSIAPSLDTECTSVIVTGSAAKDGRAILMKNRDSQQTYNVPIYHPATNDTYAFVAINSMWMGMNERGLAVMNTAMPDLAEGPDYGSFNGPLNRIILERCENVSEVISRLFAKTDPLISDDQDDAVATCVGVIDRWGNGAFLEISNTMVSVEYVRDGYQSRANHPRTYPDLASGPHGRDQYALDALDDIFSDKGVISWQDVAQVVSRNVRDKDQGYDLFPISGEMCNDNTVSAMVAVSGDAKYDGALNVVWFSCGQVPMVSVFVPAMAGYGESPEIWEDMVDYTQEKDDYARPSGTLYDPTRVQEIQDYAFAAEDYTFTQYDRLMEQIRRGLTDTELNETITDFVDLTVAVATDMYVNESSDLPEYAIPFEIPIITSITTTTTSTISTDTTSSSFISEYEEDLIIETVVGFSLGIMAVAVISIIGYQKLLK